MKDEVYTSSSYSRQSHQQHKLPREAQLQREQSAARTHIWKNSKKGLDPRFCLKLPLCYYANNTKIEPFEALSVLESRLQHQNPAFQQRNSNLHH